MTDADLPTIEEIKMEWDEWFAKYQPVMVNATQDDGDVMEFSTCQEAADYIKENMPEVPEEDRCTHVWTETGGDGWYYVSTGYHVVDRMHCFVCKVPWTNVYEACMYNEWATTPDNETEGCIWEGDWSE